MGLTNSMGADMMLLYCKQSLEGKTTVLGQNKPVNGYK
jgi:hypothetical protein